MDRIALRQNAVATATPQIYDMSACAAGVSFMCKPGAGGTMTVEFSNSPLAVTDPTNAANIWADSGLGSITDAAAKEVIRTGPCKAARVSAATAAGVCHVAIRT